MSLLFPGPVTLHPVDGPRLTYASLCKWMPEIVHILVNGAFTSTGARVTGSCSQLLGAQVCLEVQLLDPVATDP